MYAHARDVERRARHELTQLLAGSQLQRDVLGQITAAGGGLTLDDLEELTEQPPYEIEGLLGGLFGRSVGSRIGATSAGYRDERVIRGRGGPARGVLPTGCADRSEAAREANLGAGLAARPVGQSRR